MGGDGYVNQLDYGDHFAMCPYHHAVPFKYIQFYLPILCQKTINDCLANIYFLP